MSGKNGKVRTCYWCRRWPGCGTPITERREEVVNGVTLSDNVSQLTHIIGGLCGAFLGLGMRR